MRRNYQTWSQSDFRGGINQEPESATPNQLFEALNVWSPNGFLEQRPGLVGIQTFPPLYTTSSSITSYITTTTTSTSSKTYATTGDPTTTYTAPLINYIIMLVPADLLGLTLNIGVVNTSNTGIFVEYYSTDGTWRYLLSFMSTGAGLFLTNQTGIYFSSPRDISVTGVSFKGRIVNFRISYLKNSVDAGVTITSSTKNQNNIYGITTTQTGLQWLLNIQYQTSRITMTLGYTSTNKLVYKNHGEYFGSTGLNIGSATDLLPLKRPNQVSYATLPEFNTAYIATGGTLYEVSDVGTVKKAISETDPLWVGIVTGVKAFFHPDNIAQSSPPECEYVAWYQNHLFAFNLPGAPNTFRWSGLTSAQAIGFRVWPSVSFDYLSEDDNSPITGCSSLGEHLIVFKGDSMWRIVNTGQSGPTTVFQPIKITSSVGCQSHMSITKTPAGLMWYANDGFYIWDGTHLPELISHPIQQALSELTDQNQLVSITGVHWASRNCVLWTVPNTPKTRAVNTTQTVKNDTTFVYNYKYKAWWIWQGLGTESFAVVEDSVTNEDRIYQIDSQGTIAQLTEDVFTDLGEQPTVYATTHRFGFENPNNLRFREVDIVGSNTAASLTASVIGDDSTESELSGTVSFTEDLEAKYGSAVVGTDTFPSEQYRRRRIMINESNMWLQLKIANTVKDQPLVVTELAVAGYGLGRR